MRILRKFRQEIVSQGKVRKYTLYVIGELFLIVLGIIIAVQINNWNTTRKFKNTEKVYLNRLKTDLQRDLARYQFLDTMYQEDLKLCSEVLKKLGKPLNGQAKLEVIAIGFLSFYTLNPSTATYDELVNTGKLYSTSNKELREQIVGYYNDLERQNQYLENSNVRVKKYMDQESMNDYWLLKRKIYADLPIENSNFPWLSKSQSAELRSIETMTYIYQSAIKKNLNRIANLKRSSSRLINLLEAESE